MEGAPSRDLQELTDETVAGGEKATSTLKHGFRSDPERPLYETKQSRHKPDYFSCTYPPIKDQRQKAQTNVCFLKRKKVIDCFPQELSLSSIFRNNLCTQENGDVIKFAYEKELFGIFKCKVDSSSTEELDEIQ